MIRIQWNGPRTRIRPSAERAVAALGRSFKVLPELRLRRDAMRDPDAQEDEDEARILAHVENGETLAAVKLARRLHGMSLAEAREFVESLREK